jgi:energy-coupling factor transporter ATP-binding protein EcfA2
MLGGKLIQPERLAEANVMVESLEAEGTGTAGRLKLTEVKYIQNIGRFEKAKPTANVGFGHCTLVFGENGWGKSTLADILRSLTTNNPAIVVGRKTLAGGPEQKAILRFGTSQAAFENAAWTGPKPRIAVYDSVFVNENVFSGDIVSADHLKNQYGLVVGAEGVRLVRRIVALDDENRVINSAVRNAESEVDAVIRSVAPAGFRRGQFLGLLAHDDIDWALAEKDAEVQRARRAKEIKAAAEPQLLPVPTEIAKFRDLLGSHIDGIAEKALTAVRAHITAHQARHGGPTSHEAWLETGTAFMRGDKCPFCGQNFDDRALVDAYKNFFSTAYKTLAENVQKARETFARYSSGDFRRTIENLAEQNTLHFGYWREVGRIEPPDLPGSATLIADMEGAAAQLDSVFQEKQSNLTQAATGAKVEGALAAWERARARLVENNGPLGEYLGRVKAVKDSIDPSHLPRLENELKVHKAAA